jgi:hypothetical protein
VDVANRLVALLELDPATQEYRFVEGAAAAIDALLDEIFTLDESAAAIDDILRLACALEGELSSPDANIMLRSVLRSHARFRETLIANAAPRSSSMLSCAPMFGATAPVGTIKVGAFLRRRTRL